VKDYRSELLRNIGLVGHGGSGKTTLAEAMLFAAGATNRQGKVEDGSTVLDFDPDEIQRKNSISLSASYCEWRENKLNLVACPGYADFVGEVWAALKAVDTALVVLQPASAIELGTETAWKIADHYGIPKAVFVTKLRRENTDFYQVLKDCQKRFGPSVVALTLPLGKAEGLSGVIPLWKENVPAEAQEYREKMVEAVAAADDALMEKYLEGGSLTGEQVAQGLRAGIREGKIIPVLCGDGAHGIGVKELLDFIVEFLPAPNELSELAGKNAAGKEVVRKREAGAPFCAFAFKTMTESHAGALTYLRVFSGTLEAGNEVMNANRERAEKFNQLYFPKGRERVETPRVVAGDLCVAVKLKDTPTNTTLSAKNDLILLDPITFPEASISVAIEPKTKGDEDKVSSGLAKLKEEDPTFSSGYRPEIKQMLISGLGEVHLDVIVARLKRKFGVDIGLHKPRIAYHETIRKKVEVEYKHKKQTGGHGQFGHVFLRLEPQPRGGGFEFLDEIKGGVVPNNYIPSVEKGIKAAMQEGALAGYSVVDVSAALYYGSYHPVDSSGASFEIAGAGAFRKGTLEANPVLLEPVMELSVTVPEENMGDVVGDLNSKRGKIQGMEAQAGYQTIRALVPEAELYRYSTSLRSMTQGRGAFTMKFSHYDEVPHEIALRVIEEAKKEKEEKNK
jgi:elongation factor G